MRSANYELFAQAMREKKQVLCNYHNRARALCPIILGHTKGEEVALTYQFAGKSERGEPVHGGWRCLKLAEVSFARLQEGPWVQGERHSGRQSCVDAVDLDIDPDSPYQPQRKL